MGNVVHIMIILIETKSLELFVAINYFAEFSVRPFAREFS